MTLHEWYSKMGSLVVPSTLYGMGATEGDQTGRIRMGVEWEITLTKWPKTACKVWTASVNIERKRGLKDEVHRVEDKHGDVGVHEELSLDSRDTAPSSDQLLNSCSDPIGHISSSM